MWQEGGTIENEEFPRVLKASWEGGGRTYVFCSDKVLGPWGPRPPMIVGIILALAASPRFASSPTTDKVCVSNR